MTKIRELREKTENELKTLLAEKRESLRKFYFQMAHGKIKNTKEGRETKRSIARIITLLKEPAKK